VRSLGQREKNVGELLFSNLSDATPRRTSFLVSSFLLSSVHIVKYSL
jgi:hypothetical protein